MTGDTVYEAVKDKADKDYVDEQLSGKADADLGNLTDEGKDVIKDIAKDTIKVEDGLNTTVAKQKQAIQDLLMAIRFITLLMKSMKILPMLPKVLMPNLTVKQMPTHRM